MNDDIKLKKLVLDESGLNMQFQGTPMHLVAEAFASQFKESGATNYLEMSLIHDDIGEFVVTMQRKQGLTPSQKLADCEQQLQSAKAEIDELKKELANKSQFIGLDFAGDYLNEVRNKAIIEFYPRMIQETEYLCFCDPDHIVAYSEHYAKSLIKDKA